MTETTTRPVLPSWDQLLAACWDDAGSDSSDAHPVVKAASQLAKIHRAALTTAVAQQPRIDRAALIGEINSWVGEQVPGLDILGGTVDEFTRLGVVARVHVEANSPQAAKLDMEKLADSWTQVTAEVEEARTKLIQNRERESSSVS